MGGIILLGGILVPISDAINKDAAYKKLLPGPPVPHTHVERAEIAIAHRSSVYLREGWYSGPPGTYITPHHFQPEVIMNGKPLDNLFQEFRGKPFSWVVPVVAT